MKKHIYTANRGEGKTTWLINRVLDSKNADHEIYYLGSKKCFLRFREKCWEAGVTGVKHITESIPNAPFDVFTDEFLDAFFNINKGDFDFANTYACNWYLTMSKEDFVD